MSNNYIRDNLAAVKRHIHQVAVRSGREPDEITLVAVSKTRSLDEVKLAIDAGQKDFGENTVQDAMSKIPYLSNKDIEWHFIGHLQSKKAGKLPGYFQWIHSIDSLKLAKKLSTALYSHSKNSVMNCLIQVNVSGEATKSGLLPNQVEPFLQEILQLELPCLRWRGLMTIGVRGNEDENRNNI